MDLTNVKSIISEDSLVLIPSLDNFLDKYKQQFTFAEFDQHNIRNEIWTALFSHLNNEKLINAHMKCLSAIRILSRDKTNLNEMINDKWLNTLLIYAGLNVPDEIVEQKNMFPDYEILLESLKCLCNIVFNSTIAQAMSAKNGTLEGIIKRLLTYRDPEIPFDVKFFDMRLLFLITGYCSEVRPKLKEELHGVTYLTEILDSTLKESETTDPVTLTVPQVNLMCEILKTLFNLTLKNKFSITVDEDDEEEEAHYIRLVTVLHDLLLVRVESEEKLTELQNHIINLLAGLPTMCLKELVTPSLHDQELPKHIEYESSNMETIYVMLEFLKKKLDTEPTVRKQHELLPILSVLIKCANSSRKMRKYLRLQILPPLRDVHHRPEQGSTLRNHLCRLLTTLVTQVRDFAAELLFVLCKENVTRMIKYTGYGNAAGLFANRGLMGGRTNHDVSKYSSDSEDSDTEEYKEYRHGINPVMGCYEPPHPDPTAGMSEEQKEYEAMKLVDLMDKLTRTGVVQPCRIGEDGRPEPIENVLQLQEELQRQQININSDSP